MTYINYPKFTEFYLFFTMLNRFTSVFIILTCFTVSCYIKLPNYDLYK